MPVCKFHTVPQTAKKLSGRFFAMGVADASCSRLLAGIFDLGEQQGDSRREAPSRKAGKGLGAEMLPMMSTVLVALTICFYAHKLLPAALQRKGDCRLGLVSAICLA